MTILISLATAKEFEHSVYLKDVMRIARVDNTVCITVNDSGDAVNYEIKLKDLIDLSTTSEFYRNLMNRIHHQAEVQSDMLTKQMRVVFQLRDELRAAGSDVIELPEDIIKEMALSRKELRKMGIRKPELPEEVEELIKRLGLDD